MMTAQSKQSLLFGLLISCTLIVSTFYSQVSPGGEGLLIPYNSWTWVCAIVVICSGVFQIMIKNTIVLPKYWLYIAALPLGIIFSGFIIDSTQPVQWLIKIGFVLGGYLFLIALFQFKLSRRTINSILYGICLSAILHSFITYTQVMGWQISSLIPNSADNSPISFFQQININATYLTTSFFIALYLASCAGALRRSIFLKVLLVVTVFATTAILLAISSRTTLVAFAVSMPLIIYARYSQFKLNKKMSITLIAAFLLGISGGAYLSKGFAKYETKLDTQRQHARTYIYDLSWQIFKEKPLLGHGLGSFEQVFQEAKIDYPHSDKLGGQRFSHPHNELLIWLIEGGVVSLIGILIALIATLFALCSLGIKRGFTYLALLFPISFHTQVELPFYLSSALWFVWITILFVIHSHQTIEKKTKLSQALKKLISASTVLISALLIAFLIHTLASLAGITRIMFYKNVPLSSLTTAKHNMYFQSLALQFELTGFLYHDIATGNTRATQQFIQWAKPYIAIRPDPGLINNLALAYRHFGANDKALALMARAAKMYPNTATIQQRYLEIKNNVPISQFTQQITTFAEHNQSQATPIDTNK
jgi:O-antigen polymerase